MDEEQGLAHIRSGKYAVQRLCGNTTLGHNIEHFKVKWNARFRTMVKLIPHFGITKEIVPHMRIETDCQRISQQVWNAVWCFLRIVEHRNTLPQSHIQRPILTILLSLFNQIGVL